MLVRAEESLPPWLAQTLTDIGAISDHLCAELLNLAGVVEKRPALLQRAALRESLVALYLSVSLAESRLYCEPEEGRADEGQDSASFFAREQLALTDPEYTRLRLHKLVQIIAQFRGRRDVFARIRAYPELWYEMGFEIVQACETLTAAVQILRNIQRLTQDAEMLVGLP